jgi:lipopolysaccharide export system protein LptA
MRYKTVVNCLWAVLCVAAGAVRAETFLIQGDDSGREATIKIPIGAVAQLSANSCESLVGYGDPKFESMRLSGDVLISIAGSEQPIQIKADKIVVELTADSLPDGKKLAEAKKLAEGKKLGEGNNLGGTKDLGRVDGVDDMLSSSSTVLIGANNSRVFLGNVVFNLQTSSGPVEIKADRVEHQVTNPG